jgi:hypothetical protein
MSISSTASGMVTSAFCVVSLNGSGTDLDMPSLGSGRSNRTQVADDIVDHLNIFPFQIKVVLRYVASQDSTKNLKSLDSFGARSN